MKKRILSFLLALLMVVGMFPTYPAYAVETEKEVTVSFFNSASETMEEADEVGLYRGGEQTLFATLRDDVSGDIQWQIEAEDNFWVDIQGGIGEDLRVSYGMVKSLLKNDAVRMRCVISGDAEYYSDPFTVIVTDVDNRMPSSTFNIKRTPPAPDPLPAPVGIPNETEPATEEAEFVITEENKSAAMEEMETVPTEEAKPAVTEETEPALTKETETVITEEIVVVEDVLQERIPSSASAIPEENNSGITNEDTTYYTVTIEYVYTEEMDSDGTYVTKFHGQRVALPYIAEVAHGSTLSETVTSPNCVGYSPNISSINLEQQGPITSNINLTVLYRPAEVSYTVRHYQQNVDDDDYTWVDTTLETGLTEALTSDNAAKTYTGFTALTHYHEEIAADSSTVIDIYYDRNYYLMSFDLDGGHGVQAVYARYGADISVSDPQRAGYSFNGWSLDGTAEISLPSTMPAGNSSYTALWNAGNSSYTIAYWLENADTDNQYDFAGSVSANANSGDSVSGSDSAVANSVFTADERKYFAYNADKTDVDVTVAGDGSTVVNVYYDRNEYILRFYYARSFVSNGTTYYQISHKNNAYNTVGQDVSVADWTDSNNHKVYTVKPSLSSQYAEQQGKVGNDETYTYYFFDLTVKYGQDISDIWPHTPITNAEDATTFGKSFVSWGTQPGSGYYVNHTDNRNIKGPYSIVDSDLLVDAAVVSPAVNHNMVAYYGTPTMWTCYIYYTPLKSQTGTETYDGQSYVLYDTIKYGAQVDNVSKLDYLQFPGVTYVGRVDNISEKSTKWFYTRAEHTVTLDDNYGTKTTYTIPYGDTLNSYITTAPTPDYPADLPDGAYEFGGWYQSKEGIGALDTSITMPNEDLIYYAKWNPKSYTVTIDDGNGKVLSTEQVNYGAKATKPTDPTMENATFTGWYYMDANNTEQRFDFDNMTITSDMTIYAKWRSNVMKAVEIHYVVVEDGTQTQVADTETLMLRLGQTRTFDAKTGSSLYPEYRTGCFPVTASHSITITDADIENPDPVTFTFEYKQYGAVPYQVEFYVQELNGTERPAFKKDENGKAVFMNTYEASADPYIEQHWQNDKAVVTELYVPDNLANSTWVLPDNYLPNALKIQKIIVPSETNPETNIAANTIKFVYTYTEPDDPDNPVYEARYLVQHFIQSSSDQTVYSLYSYSDETGLSGDTATASPISIPGYTYSQSVTYSNKGNNTLKDDVLSGTINADDSLELNFYYTVNSYPYQIMYLEEGTNRVLLNTKTTDSDGNQLTGLYGASVSYTLGTDEENELLTDYDVDAETKSIYIQMEAGNTASINTIVFYYTRKSADLIISKTVALDPDQAAEEGITSLPDEVLQQEFVFTIECSKGFHKSVYDYTRTEGETTSTGKINAGTTSMSLRLKSGESVAIHDLAMGEYTVTETYVPGFRTSVNGIIQQSYKVQLNTANVDATAPFVNTYPFYTGDLVVMKRVVKLNASDPDATGPYKVRVTLMPEDEARELDRVITWKDSDGTMKTFTVPALTGSNDEKTFTFDVSVPTGGEVKMEGVPVGDFKVEELTNNDTGYITDYYKVTYNKALHQNDEVTGTYDPDNGITGEIHGGHPTAVTFTNTYKKGSLTIQKTVTQEYEKDSWQSDTFTFQITGTTELPDGTYNITVGGNAATAIVTNGVLTLTETISISKNDSTPSWSGSLTFENLPAGYYTVTETAGLGNDKYTAVGPEGSLLVNDTAAAAEANFTNTYKRTTGNLQVGKEIVIVTAGSIIDTEQEFAFIVEPKDGMLTGSYACTVKTTNGTTDTADDTIVENGVTSLMVSDGKLTFKLKHNQYILIEGLPVGEYLVKEEAVEGYDSSFGDVITNAGNYSVDPATITTNNTTVLNCQNAYPVYYSNLIVKKTVVTPADHSAVDQAPADDVFIFTVAISGYSSKVDLTKGVTAKFYDSTDTLIKTEAILLNADSITFTLKAGEWVDLNLPACTYTIAETGLESTVNSDVLADHYDTTYSVGETVGTAGASYILVSGEKETVIFTNTYKRHYTDLTITKTGSETIDANQSFLFHVRGNGLDLDVVIHGNNSVTIDGLSVGQTYTVTENTDWSWRYDPVDSSNSNLQSQSITIAAAGNTVTFDNTRNKQQWLNGGSWCDNRFTN